MREFQGSWGMKSYYSYQREVRFAKWLGVKCVQDERGGGIGWIGDILAGKKAKKRLEVIRSQRSEGKDVKVTG
jgi:hypothetical protein